MFPWPRLDLPPSTDAVILNNQCLAYGTYFETASQNSLKKQCICCITPQLLHLGYTNFKSLIFQLNIYAVFVNFIVLFASLFR